MDRTECSPWVEGKEGGRWWSTWERGWLGGERRDGWPVENKRQENEVLSEKEGEIKTLILLMVDSTLFINPQVRAHGMQPCIEVSKCPTVHETFCLCPVFLPDSCSSTWDFYIHLNQSGAPSLEPRRICSLPHEYMPWWPGRVVETYLMFFSWELFSLQLFLTSTIKTKSGQDLRIVTFFFFNFLVN